MRGVPALLRASTYALMIALATANPAAAAGDRCYEDWSAAAPIIEKEMLAKPKDVQAGLAKLTTGKVLNITLCQEKGRWVYRVVVLEGAGRVRNHMLDAKRPF